MNDDQITDLAREYVEELSPDNKVERSMISPDYARNFICDFILGKEQRHSQKSLFDL